MPLAERWQRVWSSIREGEAHIPARVAIPADHVAWPSEEQSKPFVKDEHYFLVRVNQLYLTYSRKWFQAYDPMVLVVSEFTYDTQEQAVPFVVGPSLLEGRGHEAPKGMVFSDTRVAGLHPWRGGRLSLSVVLSQVERENYAADFLKILESTVGVLDFATALTAYVKVAGVALDGVKMLFEMGGGTKSLVGYRIEYDDAAAEITPGFFALIDAEDVDLDKLWVRGNELHVGESLETSKPYRDADFVLYSILQAAARNDERILPFYPLVTRVETGATSTQKADWKRAKGDMASLWQTLILSPDLTRPQSKALANQYRARLEELLADAKENASPLGTERADGSDPIVADLREAADILDL